MAIYSVEAVPNFSIGKLILLGRINTQRNAGDIEELIRYKLLDDRKEEIFGEIIDTDTLLVHRNKVDASLDIDLDYRQEVYRGNDINNSPLRGRLRFHRLSCSSGTLVFMNKIIPRLKLPRFVATRLFPKDENTLS